MKQGLVVGEKHRVSQFQQNKWLGVYITKNTVMGKQDKNDFEKNLSKLMSIKKFREDHGKREKAIGYKDRVQSSASTSFCPENSFQIPSIYQARFDFCILEEFLCCMDKA